MLLFTTFKNHLKKILPPPVNAFMREVNILKTMLNDHKQIDEFKLLLNRQNEAIKQIQNLINIQNTRLNRLYELFESVNRENLRQFLDLHCEETILQQQLNNLKSMENRQYRLTKQLLTKSTSNERR